MNSNIKNKNKTNKNSFAWKPTNIRLKIKNNKINADPNEAILIINKWYKKSKHLTTEKN